MKGMAWNVIWWCILTTSRNYFILVTVCWFSYICHNFDEAKLVRFGFQILGIVWIMHGKNGLKCEMLMYPDRLQKLFDFGHGLVVFLLLAYFWLSEMGHVPDMSYYTRNIMGFMYTYVLGLHIGQFDQYDMCIDTFYWYLYISYDTCLQIDCVTKMSLSYPLSYSKHFITWWWDSDRIYHTRWWM